MEQKGKKIAFTEKNPSLITIFNPVQICVNFVLAYQALSKTMILPAYAIIVIPIDEISATMK